MYAENFPQISERLKAGRLERRLRLCERGRSDARNFPRQKEKSIREEVVEDSFFDGDSWVGYRTYVKLVREKPRRRRPYPVRAPQDIYRVFASLAQCDRERFYAAHLDAQNRVCGVELVSQGTATSCLVTPREFYKSAILANATGLIAVHNHPSGIPTPSADDRAVTRQLVEAGRILDIPLYDHVIVGDEAYWSFAEAGML